MASVTIVMSADDARLQAAHERLFAQQAKALENFQKSVNKSKEAQAQAQADLELRKAAADAEKARLELIAKGQKLIENQRDAQERHNAALAEAEELKAAGAISETDLARRKEVLIKRLHEESGEAKKAKDAEAQLTEAHRRAAEIIKSTLSPMDKYNQKFKELVALKKQGVLTSEQFAKAEEHARREVEKLNTAASADNQVLVEKNSLLGDANKQIIAYATGLGSAATVAALLRATWRQITDEQKKGLEGLKSTQEADRNLLQVAGTPEEFNRLQLKSDALSASSGVDRVVSREIMFQAKSENFESAVPAIMDASQVVDPKVAAGIAGQVPALFNGTINGLEALNLTLKASVASRLDFEPFARALPNAVEGSAIAKASPEETMAVLSVLASKFRSGDIAADRIKAFGTVAGIDQGGMTEEQKKTQLEKVESARKELRRKEEAVSDIQAKLDNKNTKKEARPDLQKRLGRAQREVDEFDRTSLEVPKPRESFAGKGLIAVAKELQAMSVGKRQEFLGSSQELNVAYNYIIETLPEIEKQLSELKQERMDAANGKGTLLERVAISRSNPQQAALRNEAIAQRKLEIESAYKDGLEGASASGATADATRMLKGSSAPTRAVGSVVAGTVAGGLSQAGLNQEDSANVTSAFIRAIGLVVPGLGFGDKAKPAENSIAADPAKIFMEASKLNKEAAQINLEAANRRAVDSVTPAARAQAAGARN